MTIFDLVWDIAGRILNFVDLHNGAVTAVATIFIATFTIVLAVVTRRQARLTRIVAKAAQRSASVAERALVELERPFAFVEVIDAGIGINPTTGFLIGFAGQQFRFQVINYGRTPAFLIDRLTVWPIEAGSAMPYEINPETQRGPQFLAGSTAGYDRPYEESRSLSPDVCDSKRMATPQSWEENRVFFIGYVRYQDIFGNIYVNGFCFVFDTLVNRFVR